MQDQSPSSMTTVQHGGNGRESYEQILAALVQTDTRYVVMTAENRAAIRTLPQMLGKRFIDTGITEQAMVGMAAGLALRGRTPVCHALAAFLTMRAFEFVRTDIGLGNLPVKLIGSVPGFLSEGNGPTHQALEDVALMRGIPNVQIFCPADAQDLAIGLPHVLSSAAPVYVRHIATPPVTAHQRDFTVGRAEVIGNGRDVAILTYGLLFGEAVGAIRRLREGGLAVRLLNLRMLKPVDEAAILRAAAETRLLVTLEDHFLTGGLFSIVSELLVRTGQAARVLPLALPDRWFSPALLPDVLVHAGFSAAQIAERILQVWNDR